MAFPVPGEPILNAELTEIELRAALHLAATSPAGLSPMLSGGRFLTPASAPLSGDVLGSLRRKGLLKASADRLDDGWRALVGVLANPLWRLSLALQRDVPFHDHYYASAPTSGAGEGLGPNERLYFHRAQDGRHHLAGPFPRQHIQELLNDTLGLVPGPPVTDSGVELDYREYVVLLAAVDVLRERMLRALLDRRDEPVPRHLTLVDVQEAWRNGVRHADRRWLMTLGHAISPFPFKAEAPATLRTLLEALCRHGYLTADGEAWQGTEPLLAMASSLLVVSAFAALALAFSKGPDRFEINYFASLRGTGFLWLLDFFELASAAPRVSLNRVGGDELAEMIDGLITESYDKIVAPASARPTHGNRPASPPTLRMLGAHSTVPRPRPSELSADRPAGALPDGEPPRLPWGPIAPQPTVDVARQCAACDAALTDGARFCTHCGANVDALRERTCPACNGRLATNARFCAFCGQAVH